jgi:hypothetical protein
MLLQTKRQLKSTKIIYFTLSLIINTSLPTQAAEKEDYYEEACYNKRNCRKIRSYNSKLGVIDGYFDPRSDTRRSLSQSTESPFLDKDPQLVAYRAHSSRMGGDHANHVSSIIHQIAQGAKLRIIDVYDEPSVKLKIGHTARLVAAIDAAIESKVDFINISQRISSDTDWNGEVSEELKKALYRARDAGLGIIKSAGNDNEHIGSTPYTKSLAELLYTMRGSMILVGATGPEDRGHENLAHFSNKAGSAYKYMVSAPGTNISAYGASNVLVRMSGTSMAAPVVTLRMLIRIFQQERFLNQSVTLPERQALTNKSTLQKVNTAVEL